MIRYSLICNEMDFNTGDSFLTSSLAEVNGKFNELWGLCKRITIAENSHKNSIESVGTWITSGIHADIAFSLHYVRI